MQLIDTYRKECYVAPLFSIDELEFGVNLCQTSADTRCPVAVDPDFEDEITIILG